MPSSVTVPVTTILVVLVSVSASLFIAALAGRNVRYAPWGFVGPIGWVVAAIHGLEDRRFGRPPPSLSVTEALGSVPLAPGEAEHPCPNCRAPLRAAREREGSRVPCANCGSDALFGPRPASGS